MKIKQILYEIFYKKTYLYVPPCPKCKSRHTGYIMYCQHNDSNERLKIEKMQRGELVQIQSVDVNANNYLFCDNCGLEWAGEPIKKRLTKEEIEEQKELRGLTEEYIQQRDIRPENLYKFKYSIDNEEEKEDNINISSKRIKKDKNPKQPQKQIKIKK